MPPKNGESTWMKNHPLEGDDIVTGFYNFLTKRNPKTMKPCRDIFVPDTVVFEHNFPRGWYTTDVKAREVMRKQGRELDASTIEKGFKDDIPDTCPIVATYLSTREEVLADGSTETKTLVEVFNKDTIGEFLARKNKQEGILQKFVMPKGYHNSVIKAVWSPRVCMVQRRTNKFTITDKKRAEGDPFSTTVTYEGPTYLSEEGTISGNIANEVKKLCGHIVQHFYYTEHKFITRMVVFFKADKRDRLWFMWCGSLRVSDRNAASEMPVNLITNFTEPDNTATFNENKLLWDADEAYLRVTNDEMFYETYMKNGMPYLDSETDRTKQKSQPGQYDDRDDADDSSKAVKGQGDWNYTPSVVKDAVARLNKERGELTMIFEDIFYKARSHFIINKNEAYTVKIPARAVEILSEDGVADLMNLLQLLPRPGERDPEDPTMRYIMNPSLKNPLTKQHDDTIEWLDNFFGGKQGQLKDATQYPGSDQDALRARVENI